MGLISGQRIAAVLMRPVGNQHQNSFAIQQQQQYALRLRIAKLQKKGSCKRKVHGIMDVKGAF